MRAASHSFCSLTSMRLTFEIALENFLEVLDGHVHDRRGVRARVEHLDEVHAEGRRRFRGASDRRGERGAFELPHGLSTRNPSERAALFPAGALGVRRREFRERRDARRDLLAEFVEQGFVLRLDQDVRHLDLPRVVHRGGRRRHPSPRPSRDRRRRRDDAAARAHGRGATPRRRRRRRDRGGYRAKEEHLSPTTARARSCANGVVRGSPFDRQKNRLDEFYTTGSRQRHALMSATQFRTIVSPFSVMMLSGETARPESSGTACAAPP